MSQLLLQIILGGLLIGAATIVQAVFIGLLHTFQPRMVFRARRLGRWWLTGILSIAALWLLTGQMIGVGLWSGILVWLGALPDFEQAIYYTLSAYTTLGFGDVLPPPEWRVFGAVIGANGMLGFGIATAVLVDLVSRIQNELRR